MSRWRRSGRRPGRHEEARRARRAALGALRERGWVLPRSLARDDVVPRWTRIGVVDGPSSSTVDDRGLVTVHDRISVDWAIGAEDRWHHPGVEPNVAQARLDHAPVVETELRVPGGTVVHRAFAARGSAYGGGDEWVVVEVENRSAVPVVLAWVIRPFSPTAVTPVERMEVTPLVAGSTGPAGSAGSAGPRAVVVDGEVVAILPRAPSRWAAGADGRDPLVAVVEGAAAVEGEPVAQMNQGSGGPVPASLVLLHPLPHTVTTRLVLPAAGVGAAPPWPGDLPESTAVAAGWTLRADRGVRVGLPDPVLGDAVEAARRSLALNHRVERAGPAVPDRAAPTHHRLTSGTGRGTDDGPATGVEMLAAEAWWAPPGESAGPASRWGELQRDDATFGSIADTAAAVRALALHAIAADDTVIAEAWLPELSGAIEVLGRAARRGDGDRAAVSEGLDAAAVLLERLGQADAASRVRADRPTGPVEPRGTPGSGGPPNARGEVPADRAVKAPTGAEVDSRGVAAAAVAVARDGGANEPLWALLRAASSTWTWPDVGRWTGDDGLVTARFLDAVGRLLLRDGPDGVALVPWLPPGWWGRGWEVHGAPTRWGRLSYAVRWHGDRPAVLWDLAGPRDRLPLSAPGLDPTWSADSVRGEALLAPVPPPPDLDLTDPAGPADPTDPGAVAGADGTSDAGGGDAGPVRGVAIAAPPRSVWRPQDPGPDAPAGGAPFEGDAPDGGDGATDGPGLPPEGTSFS